MVEKQEYAIIRPKFRRDIILSLPPVMQCIFSLRSSIEVVAQSKACKLSVNATPDRGRGQGRGYGAIMSVVKVARSSIDCKTIAVKADVLNVSC